MPTKLTKSLAVLAAVLLPVPVFLVESSLLMLLEQTGVLSSGTETSHLLYQYVYPIIPPLVGFVFLPLGFGRRALWVGLVYVPVMTYLVFPLTLDLGSLFGGVNVWP